MCLDLDLPGMQVAKHFRVPIGTAKRWVWMAPEAHELPPTKPGKSRKGGVVVTVRFSRAVAVELPRSGSAKGPSERGVEPRGSAGDPSITYAFCIRVRSLLWTMKAG
jgi:hypothetical protein